MENELTQEQRSVHVRWLIPGDVRKKINSHRLRLSAKLDRDATQEEALINLLRSIELPEEIRLEE